jgi:NADPH:quinone reductase-like Zn-dependent oxidoreductase
MSSAAWQIRQASPSNWRSDAAIDNLFVSDVIPKPAPSELTPKSVLVRIRAASINARDMLVISRDPFYTHNTIPNLTPCADGAGEVEAVGEGSKWKIGEKVMITPGAWEDGDVVPDDFKGKGSGSVQGTLRQDAVLVSRNCTGSMFKIGSDWPCIVTGRLTSDFCPLPLVF